MNKFKVGDIVEITNAPRSYTVTGNGSIGKIYKVIYYNHYWVTFFKMNSLDKTETINKWRIQEEYLKLAKKYYTCLGKLFYNSSVSDTESS